MENQRYAVLITKTIQSSVSVEATNPDAARKLAFEIPEHRWDSCSPEYDSEVELEE